MKAKFIIYDNFGKECCASDINCAWDSTGEVFNIVCTRSMNQCSMEDVLDDEEDEWSDVWPNQNIGMDEW